MIYPFNAGEVFKIALMIEDNGRTFYQAAAKKPFSPDIIALFNDLAAEELSHKAIFKALMRDLPQATTTETVWDPDNEVDKYLKAMADQHVFNKDAKEVEAMVDGLQSAPDAVKMAMGFEKDTIVFFLEMMSVADQKESQDQIHKLVNEERKHLRRLTSILEKIS